MTQTDTVPLLETLSDLVAIKSQIDELKRDIAKLEKKFKEASILYMNHLKTPYKNM